MGIQEVSMCVWFDDIYPKSKTLWCHCSHI